ncbi:MAG: hypothetical protein OHK0056_19750 [Bacteriovoracaceae bacterium]
MANRLGSFNFTTNTGVVNASSGQIDDFMLFTNTSSHVISTAPATIDLDSDGTADFTISAWVKPTTLVAGTWARITVARKGKALYLYINDKLQNVATIGAENLISFPTLKLSVGGNATNSSSYFNGAIDDVAMYKSYLPERKVKFNYDKGFSGTALRP